MQTKLLLAFSRFVEFYPVKDFIVNGEVTTFSFSTRETAQHLVSTVQEELEREGITAEVKAVGRYIVVIVEL